MFFYFAGITLTCAVLWAFHHITWKRTGKTSSILRIESKAALFDGLITVAAGLGLGAIYLLRDGPLAAIAPIGDSLVVLLLCAAAVGTYFREFKDGLGELALASADPKHLAEARRALRKSLADDGGTLEDMSVTKMGRMFLVSVYYDPKRPVSAAEVDALNLRLIADARTALANADVTLTITEHPRRWPDGYLPV